MTHARLEVSDSLGRRTVVLDKPTMTIGRRGENDLRLAGSDVSRDHAEITLADGRYLLRDKSSRYGSFVNSESVTERALVHGDRLQFGRAAGAEIQFLIEQPSQSSADKPQGALATGDLRQLATLLQNLRALGSGRVLDEVLTLVLDSAIEVTSAERGFIMLAGDSDGSADLEMKLARARGGITLPGSRFDTSRKIPEEVYATGELRMVADLLDGDLANVHMGTVALGIRHVLCAPLRLVRYFDSPDLASEPRNIGVLYLDSREKGTLLANTTRVALDTMAGEAAVAIENARLYRETLEKARIEHELDIAGEIQRALLPPGQHDGAFFKACATSLPSRAIGGDFFDFIDLPNGAVGVAVGDVSGKGPAAALLTAKIQGLFGAQLDEISPAQNLQRINAGLVRRAVQAKYATIFYATLTAHGELTYCNAGHNPPLVFGRAGLRRLDSGGMPVGLFDIATYGDAKEQLDAGDVLVIYSDGVTEALDAKGEEFGEERLANIVQAHQSATPSELIDAIVSAVQTFAGDAPPHDDVTALVLRYAG